MGLPTRAMLAALLGCTAAFAVACGSSSKGLLSAAQSESISSQITAVSAAVKAGDCSKADSAADSLNSAVADLPSSVNQTLVSNLGQGASTVKALAAKDCSSSSSTTTSSSSTQTTTTTTTTTTTQTTSTQTVPATTTQQDTGTGTGSATAPQGTGTTGQGGAPLSTQGNGQ